VNSPRSRQIGALVLALGILALGVFFFKGVFDIRVLPSYARVGPRFFPFVVSIGLIICGILLALQAWLGKTPEPQEEENVDIHAPVNVFAIAILSMALLLNVFLMERLGFILSSTLLFFAATLAFGSRQYLRNALWGLGLAVLVFFVFTRFLNLNLPSGILPW
jgi:putative tricarboxylic transport membrane protein